ncbi:hypothetical protein DSM112329_02351 [Paraconexibacter sp. AEG42_29]|uniref:Lmo0937 family membrane protein n=1 Tax=Paraconexibacter sp. AEG42_29 TaxID=2997339 RepID=A0AAU7AVI8_9ACTN
MRDRASSVGNKAIAVLVLLVALWILGSFVIGFITGIVKILAVLAAIVALFWALNRL